MNPKVAIVIPSYNSSKFLEHCVESALSQTYDNLKVYIYDNESTDGSYEQALELSEKSDILETLQVPNIYKRSYREAFEDAFLNLDFDYVTFLASDDYISKDYISSYMSIISRNPRGIKCLQSPICGVRGNIEAGYISHKYKSLAEFKDLCLMKSPVATPTVIYHKSIYEFLVPKSHLDNEIEYGGAEDYDMYCNLADNGVFIYPVPKFLGYFYRWHQNQNTWKVHQHKNNFNYDSMIQKYWKTRWK